jgi:hypothetical protein
MRLVAQHIIYSTVHPFKKSGVRLEDEYYYCRVRKSRRRDDTARLGDAHFSYAV